MLRPMVWRVLALVVFAAAAAPLHATEVYQISTISSLLAGGYDGDTTVGELLRLGNFGLGTFNGVDGEMMVLDGEVYRGTVDGRAHVVAASELTPFAVVVALHPQGSVPVAAGHRAALQRIAGARRTGERPLPHDPLAEVMETQQVVHTIEEVEGTLIGFRFPAAASSVNAAGWHFHFLSADKTRGGHVLGLTTGAGVVSLEEFSDLLIRFPVHAPAGSANADAIRAVERQR